MADYPGLAFREDGNTLVALVQPTVGHPALDRDALQAELDRLGYGCWQLYDDALNNLVERYNAAATTTEPNLTVGERVDARFSLEIASDAMQAWATIVPSQGGKALEPESIYLALGEAGVTFGIDEAAIGAACRDDVAARVLAAAGVPAVRGEDTRFELLVADARDRTPHINDKGLIDFREQGAIPTVSAEQELMRRIPPTPGTAGRTIRGETIEAEAGKNEPFADNLSGAIIAR